MKTLTIDEIRTAIIEEYSNNLPNLDLSEGTPERDIFIEAPLAGILQPLWLHANYITKLYAPHVYYNELEEADIDAYAETYQITPISATYSTGQVTFFTYTEPEDDIVIPIGTKVGTVATTPIEFNTTSEGIIYAESNLSYYSITDGRWEITVNVEADKSGPNYRAGVGAITQLLVPVTGIEGCINKSVVSGGEPAETIEERLNRITRKFQGRDLSATAGLKSFMESFSETVNIVGANDPLMERDEGLGGSIDIYIIGEEVETATDRVTVTSEGLSNPINVNYTNTTVTLTKQPVSSVTSLLINGTSLGGTYYSLQKDSGILKNSPQASDYIELTPTSGYQKWGFNSTTTSASSTGLSDDRTSGYQSWGFSSLTTLAAPSGLDNNGATFYGCRIVVDGTSQDILITGSEAQTIQEVLENINNDLTGAVCEYITTGNGFFKITSNTTGASSTIEILDGGATGQTYNLFLLLNNTNPTAETAVDGIDGIPLEAQIGIDGVLQDVSIYGYNNNNISDVISNINSQITGATMTFDATDYGYLLVTSETAGSTSTIDIVDINLFSELNNINSSVSTAIDGAGVLTFVLNDTISITYSYNKLLEEITNTINEDANHYHGRNYLIREMDTVTIDLYVKIKEVSGQDFSRVSSSVSSAISNYIESVKTSGSLELADIVGVIKNNGGVDNIDLETIELSSEGGTKIGTDLFFDKNVYITEGDITIERWTS